MGKIDRLLLWANLLINPASGISASHQRNLCDAVEKRYPISLVRAKDGDRISTTCVPNTKILLDYLEILEQEEK